MMQMQRLGKLRLTHVQVFRKVDPKCLHDNRQVWLVRMRFHNRYETFMPEARAPETGRVEVGARGLKLWE